MWTSHVTSSAPTISIVIFLPTTIFFISNPEVSSLATCEVLATHACLGQLDKVKTDPSLFKHFIHLRER